MKATDLTAAIVAMAKARDFISNTVTPGVQEMQVRHELADASARLKCALNEIGIKVSR